MTPARRIARVTLAAALATLIVTPRSAAAQIQMWDVGLKVGAEAPANQTPEKQKAYVDDRKLTSIFTFDRSSAAMKAFAVPHTSYIVVVGTNRRVAYTGVGDDQDVDAVLAKLGTP